MDNLHLTTGEKLLDKAIFVSLIALGIPIVFIGIVGAWVLAIDLALTMLGLK